MWGWWRNAMQRRQSMHRQIEHQTERLRAASDINTRAAEQHRDAVMRRSSETDALRAVLSGTLARLAEERS